MSSSSSLLTPGKWILFLLSTAAVSAITTLIVIRIAGVEPSARPALMSAPVAALPASAPLDAPAAGLTPPAAAPAAAASVVNNAAGDKQKTIAAPLDASAAPKPTAVSVAAAPVKPATAMQAAKSNVNVRISAVQYPGQRTREAVSIFNEGDQVDLTGWTLVSQDGASTYTFKNFALFKDSFITLYTTTGADSPTSLFWNQPNAVWHKGDVVTLKHGEQTMTVYTVR